MATVKVDHNYGGTGALTYQTISSTPVEGAAIRIWTKIDFDTGNTDTPLAVTATDANGEWVDPVFLDTGFTYVVQFYKVGAFGPDHVEVLV
jgi:hypothetical protein